MSDTIPSTANTTPAWDRDRDAFYASVNCHRVTLSDGWCPPGTTSALLLANPEHELDLVFCDDVPTFAAQMISRLTDDQLLEILSHRFGSGQLELPVLDPPTT